MGGGGRYDNLINDLTALSMPAVGVGLGFDRIVEAAVEQLNHEYKHKSYPCVFSRFAHAFE